MPISWLTALKMVPWADVIGAAPTVVDGARKLWSSVAKKPSPPALQSDPADANPGALEARIAALEATVGSLHQQMIESSKLIQTLAEQNAQLIARIEMLRRRMQRLGLATIVFAVIAVAALLVARHGA
ncbi:MAG: hypothetical protein OJF60_001371 [Burkholderiaceae bacterium]|jgi:uncharacterized coiled-coil protein SlyX|nr:MAG: hypothetical protein OJF60_001371 [Burkholderiaceae bacterium]